MLESALACPPTRMADPELLLMLVIGVAAGLVMGLIPGSGRHRRGGDPAARHLRHGARQALALLIGALAVVHTSDTVSAVLLGAGLRLASVTMLDGYSMARKGQARARCPWPSCPPWPAASSARSA